MAWLIDANVILRFLLGDHPEQLQSAKSYFMQIQSGELEVIILDVIVMEVYFVMTKFYKLPKLDVINDLKSILSLEGVINPDKLILYEALTLVEYKNIDFADALLCAKKKVEGFQLISFDNDVKKC